MSKRQFLEQMVNSIMENKIDDARKNFHQFVVESARDIHASLIETDELDDELENGEEVVEETYTEVVEAGDEIDSDIGADVGVGGEDLGPVGDDIVGDEADIEAGEGDVEGGDTIEVEVSEMDQIKNLIADLNARYAEITGEQAVGGDIADAGEEVAPDFEVGGDLGGEEAGEEAGEEVGLDDKVIEGENAEGSDDFDLTEEDLLGLEEGWTEVSVTMDGKEQGGGKFAGGEKNTRSPLADKAGKTISAKDMVSKQDAHKGYNREAAPSAPKDNDAQNAMNSGKKAWSDVNPKMDGQEQGGGKFAGGEKNTRSPLAGK